MPCDDIDGTEAEFPHRREAMHAIRIMWSSWLITGDQGDRDALAHAIAEERVRVCHGPGPLWREFTATLPGYREVSAHFAAALFDGVYRVV